MVMCSDRARYLVFWVSAASVALYFIVCTPISYLVGRERIFEYTNRVYWICVLGILGQRGIIWMMCRNITFAGIQ